MKWKVEFYPALLIEFRGLSEAGLRLDVDDGVWRVAFAFDPERKAVLLMAGDKAGASEKRFYKKLIKKADARFDEHLATIRKGKYYENDYRRRHERIAGGTSKAYPEAS